MARFISVAKKKTKRKKAKQVKSIYDLAEQTGLATSTISRVLNQRGRISMETRHRVLAAAREAGFKPRMSARQTAVAVVLDRIRYSTYGGFTASLLTHLIDQLAERDIAVEVYTENNVPRLGSRFIDAAIAMSWDRSTIDQLRKLIDVPIVVINRLDLPEFSAVASDHYQSGKLVGEYFLKLGHTRVAFLAEESDWGAQQRVQGYRDAMETGGQTLRDELVMYTEHRPAYGALRRLLVHQPTALFLAGEDLALEGTFLLTDLLGIKVPEQMSLVGLENVKVSQFTRPPLTTLCQPLDEIARLSLELAMDLIASGNPKPEQTLLNNVMIERESVASQS